jgi:hypothetical protein
MMATPSIQTVVVAIALRWLLAAMESSAWTLKKALKALKPVMTVIPLIPMPAGLTV